ncbi:MAG: hypothetical protein IPN29_16085 [Saprospiraceae bacterium]|nr:hypothetical protein [Saprospiraceae bacterium]
MKNTINKKQSSLIRSTDICLNDNGVPVKSEAAYATIGDCGDPVSECERPLAACVTPCERL